MGPGARGFIPELAERPTSVFLHGSSRPLLNWVMYALLVRSDPRFRWTDVRFLEERLDPLDPLARHVVPESQLSIIEPDELRLTPVPAGPFSTMIDPNEPKESVRRTLEFLHLPAHTQDLISRTPKTTRPAQFGLSNAHRIAGLFPTGTVQPTLRAILESGVSLTQTWADASPSAARAYDFVIGVEGTGPAEWKDAVLSCDIGNSVGPVRAGKRLRLEELDAVAEVLGPLGLSRT